MSEYTGRIALAEAGRDKGGVFCVVGEDGEGRLPLADGRRRKASRPKAKKPGHVRFLTGDGRAFGHPVIEKLKQGQPVSDRELRRALAAFKEGVSLGERRYD